MAKDISNAYLVTTGAGDVMVNTGFMDNAQRTKALLAPHRTARAALHRAYPGACRSLWRGAGHARAGDPGDRRATLRRHAGVISMILRRISAAARASSGARPSSAPRTRRRRPRWCRTSRSTGSIASTWEGGDFEVISTPGGETLDSLVVWMPKERVVFTGNLFGPVFLSMPNLCTVRGDKPRSVQRYLRSSRTPSASSARSCSSPATASRFAAPPRYAPTWTRCMPRSRT